MSKVELSGFGSVAVQKKLYLKAYISFHFIGKLLQTHIWAAVSNFL